MTRIIAAGTIFRHRFSDYPKESFTVNASVTHETSSVSKIQIVANNSVGISVLMNADEIEQLIEILEHAKDALEHMAKESE